MALFVRKNDSDETKKLKKKLIYGMQKYLREWDDHIDYVRQIFNLLLDSPEDTTIKKSKILKQLKRSGILVDDPRIQKMMDYFEDNCEKDINIVQLMVAMGGRGMSMNQHV